LPRLITAYISEHENGRRAAAFDLGTLVLLDVAQSCYFVAHGHKDMSIMPDVLGEHMFSHLWEWEGKAAPNGNAASLFNPA
jgi:hypothetical protein